jgi:hypothetical protein
MENIIMNWFSSHIPIVATWIIGIGTVSVALKKYLPKVLRFIKISRRALDLLDTLAEALKDNNITDEEVKEVLKEYNEFKEAIK